MTNPRTPGIATETDYPELFDGYSYAVATHAMNQRLADNGGTICVFGNDPAWKIVHVTGSRCRAHNWIAGAEEVSGERAYELYRRERTASLDGQPRRLLFCATCTLVKEDSPHAHGAEAVATPRRYIGGASRTVAQPWPYVMTNEDVAERRRLFREGRA
ncbi:hypothetical protein QQX09_01270 [Demequina sp. SYSU T00192]|uniref:Uncharacterized protein n=1 Tax=Demequina litoralis TaxID=3051660 RepID=A0ABT8G5R5_9MICO|nr:hypothetical protein [Demequina sp. SYSU T00192]MDN4474480.1 hypothetical protein [Demequina sp. SYSU T00192]